MVRFDNDHHGRFDAVGGRRPPHHLWCTRFHAPASMGFMLPVATPPNAIIFGSGALTAGQMLRAGAVPDLASIVIITVVAMSWGSRVLAGP
jgi:di/tricarboxylate transporter